ncbi:MAG TPA: hypothetical protein VK672_03945 [Solirubrobacteraceae bacterium]|nr:hypothetical protein [Solirubrobacteraceae bacterium]
MAVSPGGEVTTYKDGTWSAAGHISLDVASGAVACPTESFCLAVGGYASTYNGSTWTSAVPVGGGGLSSVSCSSPSLCTAVDFHGRALTYNGSMWSAPSQIDTEGDLLSVSCPSAAFCMAAGGRQHGYALTYNGTTWSTASEIDPEGDVNSVSCPSASFCMALTEHTVEGHEYGYALIYTGGAWTIPSEIDTQAALRSVSCASESFCVAVGEHDTVIYNGGSWSAPSQIYPEGILRSVSCPLSSFCVAVAEHVTPMGASNSGQALIYNGSTWSTPSEIPHAPNRGRSVAGSVSCVSSSFCMTTTRFEGAAAIFENGAWGAWMQFELDGHFSSVSCAAVSFCVVVNEAEQAFTYGSLPTGSPTTGGTGATTSSVTPPTDPPIRKGKPLVNARTGEITLEYDFPESGEAEASGEVLDGAAIEAKHERTKNCKKEYIRSGKRCVSNTPVRYGRARFAIATAGTYKLHIKATTKVTSVLKKGKTLTIHVTLVFTPAGTTDHISKTTTVNVHLKKANQSKHHAKSKR